MKHTFLILALLLSTEGLLPQNILDSYGQRPDAKTEQRVLRKFKESDCYTRGDNPKIQPHYSYNVQVHYVFDLKDLSENVFADESLFLKKLYMLPNMYSHSQQLFTEELHWKQKKNVITELYQSMQQEVNDTTPVFVEYNKFDFFEMNLSDLFNRIFRKQKIDKQLTLQKQSRQNETKNYLDSNFVVINDSVVSFGFKNKSQIAEWGKNFDISPFMPYSTVHSDEFCIKDSNIFILMIDGCSGIHCTRFYIFKENCDIWELQTTSQTMLSGQIKIRVDNKQEKIIFETESRKIGELFFDETLIF